MYELSSYYPNIETRFLCFSHKVLVSVRPCGVGRVYGAFCATRRLTLAAHATKRKGALRKAQNVDKALVSKC